jgi:hypothetical protein
MQNSLTDAAADAVVWAEQFDRILDDSFELQDEITASVLTAMCVHLVAGEQARVWHRTLKNLKALEIFYKGVHAFFRMDRDEMARARRHFETVAKMHPETSTGATAEIKNLDPSFSVTRFADTQYYRSAEFIEQFTAELRSAGSPD